LLLFTVLGVFVQIELDIIVNIELSELTGGHFKHVLFELVLDLIAFAVGFGDAAHFDALEAHAGLQAGVPATQLAPLALLGRHQALVSIVTYVHVALFHASLKEALLIEYEKN
jgi:hypothetical protein